MRTWHDGAAVRCDAGTWAVRVDTSLGCGFRVVVPAGRADDAALRHGRGQAARVADRFGARFDPAPWAEPFDPHLAWEVVGVWEHRFRAPLGAPTTRVRPLGAATGRLAAPARVEVVAGEYASGSPTAGLPVLWADALPPDAGTVDGTVGMWLDHTGELCTTTHGPLLVRHRGRWLTHRPESGVVTSWLHEQLTAALTGAPERLTPATLRAAEVAYAVTGRGVLVPLGERSATAPDDLVRAHRALLPYV